MKFTITHTFDPDILRRLDRFDQALQYIIHRIDTMTVDISRIAADVAANADSISALTTIAEKLVADNVLLAQQIRDLQNSTGDATTQAALDTLAVNLEASTALAAAEVEKINTPPATPAVA